jgi:hypothetical protein
MAINNIEGAHARNAASDDKVSGAWAKQFSANMFLGKKLAGDSGSSSESNRGGGSIFGRNKSQTGYTDEDHARYEKSQESAHTRQLALEKSRVENTTAGVGSLLGSEKGSVAEVGFHHGTGSHSIKFNRSAATNAGKQQDNVSPAARRRNSSATRTGADRTPVKFVAAGSTPKKAPAAGAITRQSKAAGSYSTGSATGNSAAQNRQNKAAQSYAAPTE